MKTLALKKKSTPSISSQASFNKKGEGSFLSSTNKVEHPFSSPNPGIQRNPLGSSFSGGHSFANVPIFPSHSQPLIQPKLSINEPGDKYEQEADAMADKVMRMTSVPPGKDEPQTGLSTLPSLQRKCAACEEEEKIQREELEEEEPLQAKPLMRKAEGGGYTASSQLQSQLNSSKGGGSPLPIQTLGFMNQAFGADFSSVRIHSDSRAAEMSQGIQAKAFTHGRDIYFNRGQYSPESGEGKRLLGHELTHVVQQRGKGSEHPICRQMLNGEEAGQSLLYLNDLTLEELKEKIITAKANSNFWAEEERLMEELNLRIHPIVISEDINLLSFEEVDEKISEIKYWLWLFPKEGNEGGLLPLDLYEALESKLHRLNIESKKPSSLKYSINPSTLNINELLFELKLIRIWQSEIKDYQDIAFDVDLEFEASSYIDELNRRIDKEYDDISRMSYNPEDLSDEAILGYILNARKKLSSFLSATDENYIMLRESLHFLEVEADKRSILVSPAIDTYLEIKYFQYIGLPGGQNGVYDYRVREAKAPLQPENMRYKLEELIALGGIQNAKNYIYILERSAKNQSYFQYYINKVNPYSIPTESQELLRSEPKENTDGTSIYGDYNSRTGMRPASFNYDISELVNNSTEMYQEDAKKVYELAKTQFTLLLEENEHFLSKFKDIATILFYDLLEKSESDIYQQMKNYEISQPLDYYTGIEAGGDCDAVGCGGYSYRYYSLIDPSEGILELDRTAQQLIAKQEELNKLKGINKNELTKAYSKENKSHEFKEETATDWQLTPVDAHNLLIQKKEYEFAILRAEAESAHPILAAYAKGEGFNLNSLKSINDSTYTSILAEKLYGHLKDIQQVRDALGDELSIWNLEQIIDITKAYMDVIPGSVRDKFIDEKVKDEKPSRWKQIAIGLITIGLALLAAIPTGGSSLIGVVAGGAAVLGAAVDVYLLYDAIKEYNLKKALTGTHYDKAKAISQEDPSLFWLAFQLVTTMVGLGGAAKSFSNLARTSRAIKEARSLEEVAENIDALRQLGSNADLGDDAMKRLEAEALKESPEARRVGIDAIEQSLYRIQQSRLLVQVTEEGERMVQEAVSIVEDAIRRNDVSFLDDLMINKKGLSPRTAYLLRRNSSGLPIPEPRFFGQAVEIQVKRMIQNNSFLSEYISQGETLIRVTPKGRRVTGYTDLTFTVGETRLSVDVTTNLARQIHADRFYGENLLQWTYDYPF